MSQPNYINYKYTISLIKKKILTIEFSSEWNCVDTNYDMINHSKYIYYKQHIVTS